MNYPLISEYIEAIKAAEDNFEQLKHLRPVLDDDGQPVMSSGNFAVVFKMKDEQTGKFHAVKCFLREQEGRAEAYRQIAEELEFVNSTFLTPIKYLDKELFVDTSNSDENEFPVLLMDWVEGQTLDKYIREHIDDQYELSLLAYQFSRLAMWLMPQPFAHGDLKPDNILVRNDGTLALVDYDGMYVPAMKGQKARELGSPDFRHPSRTEDVFDEHIDDFSLVSILLSLKAIALQPKLLEQYGASDRLLFSANDYRNISQCSLLKDLNSQIDSELRVLVGLFTIVLEKSNLIDISARLFNLNRPKMVKSRSIIADNGRNNSEDSPKRWTLLDFARQFGPKMQVGNFVNNETGEEFKSCIFTKPDGTRTFVAFSSKMGELTPKEISAMQNKLYVVQLESGNYSLCLPNKERNNTVSSEKHVENYDCDDFVIYSKNGRQGLSLKDGTIVVEPLYDSIILDKDRTFLAYRQMSDIYTSIYPKTYGEGLICCEEHNRENYKKIKRRIYGWPNLQYYMDKNGEREIVFNEDWFDKNGIPILCCPIRPGEICYFKDGFIDIEIRDGDSGYKYKVDRYGHAEYVGGNYYGQDDYSVQDYYNDNPDLFDGQIM